MFGLDGAGKTSILYYLKHDNLSSEFKPVPTIRVNKETITVGARLFEIHEVGGP